MPRAVLPEVVTPGVGPDLDGFIAAQQRLRTTMGRDAIFRIPVTPSWPAGTPLDPQTGRPYDPTVEPESGGGFTTIVKRVALVFRPIRVNVEDPLGDDERGGMRSAESMAMGIAEEDFIDVQGATQVTIQGRDFKITSMERDPGPDARYIAFAEAR